jgi:hypothetical protein
MRLAVPQQPAAVLQEQMCGQRVQGLNDLFDPVLSEAQLFKLAKNLVQFRMCLIEGDTINFLSHFGSPARGLAWLSYSGTELTPVPATVITERCPIIHRAVL